MLRWVAVSAARVVRSFVICASTVVFCRLRSSRAATARVGGRLGGGLGLVAVAFAATAVCTTCALCVDTALSVLIESR